jgi:putative ATP-dependent endonuclease of OLD family
MRIVCVEIENFRGIKKLEWYPAAGVNCLIGPGDSTKTTVLDAIELALNPRSYQFADDSDFFELVVEPPIKITVTLGGLPSEFKADDRYGLHLRGLNAQQAKIEDEPGSGLEDVLSVRVVIDRSLEARWSIFNERLGRADVDPPAMRYKDSQQFTTTRLGPYAERHLGWGRQSVLTRLDDSSDSISLQLADANRAAREAFRQSNHNVFKDTVARAEKLSQYFSVPVREKYSAELDVQGISITAGGIALHDGKLPLRRLGTGSSRLIVSALQHDAGGSHIALIDEVEHGLEPHRIARLLKYLSASSGGKAAGSLTQIFMTTHSPVVIRELIATDIFSVRSIDGTTTVRPVAPNANDVSTAQRYLRACPEAFLARKVIVGEGRTEQGLLRGADVYWSKENKESFALRGTVPVGGNGNANAASFAAHLLDLGHEVFLLLDSDEKADSTLTELVKSKGGSVSEWSDECSTEERVFLDVPWKTLITLVKLAEEFVGADSVKANINNACRSQNLNEVADLALPKTLDNLDFRRAVGKAAKKKSNPWFKDIARGERLAEVIFPILDEVKASPLAKTIDSLRQWVDG